MTDRITESEFVETLESQGFYQQGPRWRGPCKAHNGEGDNCVVWRNDDGTIAAKCHSAGCDWRTILQSLGFWIEFEQADGRPAVSTRSWVYQHLDGSTREVLRQDYEGQCTRKRCKDGDNPHKHIWQMPRGRPLDGYHVRTIQQGGFDSTRPIVLVEGEVTAESIRDRAADYIAASTIGGADSMHKAAFDLLADRDVILWPDADEAGGRAMRKVAVKLAGQEVGVKSLRLVDVSNMADLCIRAKDGLDAADILDDADLIAKLEQAADVSESDLKAWASESGNSEGSSGRVDTGRRRRGDWCRFWDLHDDGDQLLDALTRETADKIAYINGAVRVYSESRRQWAIAEGNGGLGGWLRGQVRVCREYCGQLASALGKNAENRRRETRPGLHPYQDGSGGLCVMDMDAAGRVSWRAATAADYLTDIDESELYQIDDSTMARGMAGAFANGTAATFATEALGWQKDTYSYLLGKFKMAMFGLGPQEIVVVRGDSGTGKSTLTQSAMRAFGADSYDLPRGDFNRFSTHFLAKSRFVRINEADLTESDIDLIVSLTGGERVNCEVKGGDAYSARFDGIVVIGAVDGIKRANTAKGLGRRLRAFQTRKAASAGVSDAHSRAVIADGSHGMLFDILRADIPASSRIEDAPSQVREWSRSQLLDADSLKEFVDAHYSRTAAECLVAASEVKKQYKGHWHKHGDDRKARQRVSNASIRSAFEFCGFEIVADTKRIKIAGAAFDGHDCDVCRDEVVEQQRYTALTARDESEWDESDREFADGFRARQGIDQGGLA